jgi:adenylate kinase family enzyme
MKKIIIFGNSGAGKSTLAKLLCREDNLAHLDLDTIAWTSSNPPKRRELFESKVNIDIFLSENECWVIEGCYSDLISLVTEYASEMIYLDLPVDSCIENARLRPWEPHKYESKKAQDKNLNMLIDWIEGYESRDDTFSKEAHEDLFNKYTGKKKRIKSNQ